MTDYADIKRRLRAAAGARSTTRIDAELFMLAHGAIEALEKERDEMRASALSVTRALALVEMALESEAGAQAVRKQTGGNAPESVQGILDGVCVLRDRVAELEKEVDRVRAAWKKAHRDGYAFVELYRDTKARVAELEKHARYLEHRLTAYERADPNITEEWGRYLAKHGLDENSLPPQIPDDEEAGVQ